VRRLKSLQFKHLARPKPAITAVLLLFVLLALPQLMSLYYVDTMTQVAVYSMVALALGVLVGRVGLVSLGQVAVLAVGAWVAARLLFATGQPYLLIVLEAGLVTMIAGTAIGLPALRLRGLYLALITLMLAGGITVVLYGMIGLLGAKIWKENGVDFGNPVNLVPVAAGIIIAIGNTTLRFTDNFQLTGIALGTIVTLVTYHLVRLIAPPHLRDETAEAEGTAVVVDAPGAYREP